MLKEFLELGFTHTFRRFDAAWISLAVELAREHSELITSDVDVVYPALQAAGLTLDEKLDRVLDTDISLQATVLYRISHALFRRDSSHEALKFFAAFMRVRTSIELYYSTEIGPRLRIVHGMGAVIGPRNKIGSDFTFYQGVTLGQRRQFSPHETMVIGDRCSIFAGAKLLGTLKLADDVKVAANSVLLHDATEPGTYVGSPARLRLPK